MKATEKIVLILNDAIDGLNLQEDQYDVDLSTKGMTSLVFIHVVVALEDEFECEIPDSKLVLSEMNTVNKIKDVLQFVVENETSI